MKITIYRKKNKALRFGQLFDPGVYAIAVNDYDMHIWENMGQHSKQRILELIACTKIQMSDTTPNWYKTVCYI